MLKLMKALHRNDKGFTLVELMVVVVIIGILVAIAIPIYNTVTRNAQRKAVEANLRTIDSAIMQARADGNEEPKYEELVGEFFEPIESVDQETYDIKDITGNGYYRAVVSGQAGGITLDDAYLPIDWETGTGGEEGGGGD